MASASLPAAANRLQDKPSGAEWDLLFFRSSLALPVYIDLLRASLIWRAARLTHSHSVERRHLALNVSKCDVISLQSFA
jgi:hypothetical protein